MKNFIQDGDVLSFTAPYAVASGAGFLVGQLFAVAQAAAANAAPVEGKLSGVFDLVKIGSQAWTIGAKVYWDDTNKRCTTVSTSNTFIGHAVAAVGSGAGETTGRVRVTGVPTNTTF